jgi:rsbT co-antagonist protein RsbR
MTESKENVNTIAEIMKNNQTEILKVWKQNILALPGNRTLELMGDTELQKQTEQMFALTVKAFASENYEDIKNPEYQPLIDFLREISESRARQDFTSSETSVFIFSFKEAMFQFIQDEWRLDLGKVNREVTKLNKVVDALGLITLDNYVKEREEIVGQQSRALLELSTPIMKLWESIILLPMVGVIDTQRARQLIERLLSAIVKFEAEVAILDLTGVPVVDTQVARHIIKTVNAAAMLGCQPIITGISADAAQTLAELGIDLGGVRTRGTLRTGIQEAFQILGLRVTLIES